MSEELDELRQRKMEQLKRKYMNGGNKMVEDLQNEQVTI